MEGKFEKFFDNATYFFSKTTDRQLYIYRNVLEYIDGEYVLTNRITDANIREMRNNMDEADIDQFDEFVERTWKISAKKIVEDARGLTEEKTAKTKKTKK
ncbi:hypothetical protein D3C72_1350590 [compost metagenome]